MNKNPATNQDCNGQTILDITRAQFNWCNTEDLAFYALPKDGIFLHLGVIFRDLHDAIEQVRQATFPKLPELSKIPDTVESVHDYRARTEDFDFC